MERTPTPDAPASTAPRRCQRPFDDARAIAERVKQEVLTRFGE